MSVRSIDPTREAKRRARPVSVVLGEDHRLMRRSLRGLLDSAGGIRVVAEAGDLALTRQHIAGHEPDVLVLDLDMPDGSSLELVRELHEQLPELGVVAMSLDDTPGLARHALAAGAAGFVMKDDADTQLPPAVLAALGDGADHESRRERAHTRHRGVGRRR